LVEVGCPSGHGKMTFANGDVYEGDWVYNGSSSVKQGKGKQTYANGSVYEGDYINSKWHGKGKWTDTTDGEVYIGDYVENKKHGYGKATYPDGSVKEGRWENDVFKGN
jgi:hypothetical protein